MTPAPKKKIDYDTYLKGVALFTMTNQLYMRGRKYEEKLSEILGYTDIYAGCISDEVYSGIQPASVEDFNKALNQEGFVIIHLPKKKKRKKRKKR